MWAVSKKKPVNQKSNSLFVCMFISQINMPTPPQSSKYLLSMFILLTRNQQILHWISLSFYFYCVFPTRFQIWASLFDHLGPFLLDNCLSGNLSFSAGWQTFGSRSLSPFNAPTYLSECCVISSVFVWHFPSLGLRGWEEILSGPLRQIVTEGVAYDQYNDLTFKKHTVDVKCNEILKINTLVSNVFDKACLVVSQMSRSCYQGQ